MNPSLVLALAFLIGVVGGLRSLSAPAIMAWGAHLNWLNLHNSPLAFMGATITVGIFTLLALVEFVGDKLPSTPSRTAPIGLTARIILGALCGVCLAISGMQSMVLGSALGAIGGLAGAFAGYRVRTGLVKTLKVSDFVIAALEDFVTVASGIFIVSRF